MRRRALLTGFGLIGLLTVSASDASLPLALRLKAEGDVRAAAIEFRRLAMEEDRVESQAGFLWAAAYLYKQAGVFSVADAMVDQIEDRMPLWTTPSLILRGEIALADTRTREAGFYWESLLRAAESDEQAALARRRLAGIQLAAGDPEGARRLLQESPIDETEGLRHLERFETGRDRNPRLGGLLGMIPGMGYAYAGEYANAFRSLILNSLFIYGMVDTARNNHWGGFAVITFFEITWYSGSIYGGIDASHRYNQRRLRTALDGIDRQSGFEPDWEQIPGIQLRYRF